jgi:hypothetical protein
MQSKLAKSPRIGSIHRESDRICMQGKSTGILRERGMCLNGEQCPHPEQETSCERKYHFQWKDDSEMFHVTHLLSAQEGIHADLFHFLAR